MSKNRKRTGLVHKRNKEVFNVSQDKTTLKYYIRGTDEEVPHNKLCRKPNPGAHPKGKPRYDFDKPYQAQDLGDEWSDYAWGADDF